MEAIIYLSIFEILQYPIISNDCLKQIFKDEKLRVYTNDNEIKRDILKLADLTNNVITENQDFNIHVTINNFVMAEYNSIKLSPTQPKGYYQIRTLKQLQKLL